MKTDIKNIIKKAIKRTLIILVTIVMLPFLAFGILLLVVPISRPDDSVRNYVLKQIPMGTNWDNADEIIGKKKWLILETHLESGLRINDGAGNAGFASDDEMLNGAEDPEKVRIVGTKAMFVELGEFYGPFQTAVFAYLAFDENDELVEVAIRRDIDAP